MGWYIGMKTINYRDFSWDYIGDHGDELLTIMWGFPLSWEYLKLAGWFLLNGKYFEHGWFGDWYMSLFGDLFHITLKYWLEMISLIIWFNCDIYQPLIWQDITFGIYWLNMIPLDEHGWFLRVPSFQQKWCFQQRNSDFSNKHEFWPAEMVM